MILTVWELSIIEIYHSDIKPENIILEKINEFNIDDNLIKLDIKFIDFGYSVESWNIIKGYTKKYYDNKTEYKSKVDRI